MRRASRSPMRGASTRPRSGSPRRSVGSAGQVLPLTALVVVLAMVLTVAIVRLGAQVDRRARARTAADAAALAGARGGEDMARSVAGDNRAELESFVTRGAEVEVVVRIGDERASARSRRSW